MMIEDLAGYMNIKESAIICLEQKNKDLIEREQLLKVRLETGDNVIQLCHWEVQVQPKMITQGILTDEMTFTLLKPLAMNSIINNLTKSLGQGDNSRQILDIKSPLNQASLEFDKSTNMGSRPSSTKLGQPWGFQKKKYTMDSVSSIEEVTIKDLSKIRKSQKATWNLETNVKLKSSGT